MMGDNRDNSTDSREQSPRYGVGYVPFENLVGRAEIIFFSAAVDDPNAFRLTSPGPGPSTSAGAGSSASSARVPWRAVRKLKDLEARLGYRLQGSRAAQEGADARQRAPGLGQAPRQRAARVPGRPRAGPGHRRAAERGLSRRRARASSPASTTAWCAAAPAPRWRARSISAPSLVLSESEAGSGGRDKETILADACEALLGAIFLEAGYDKARAVVRAHWGGRSSKARRPSAADAKSALQEWAQGQGLDLPRLRRGRAAQGPTTRRASPSEVRIKGRKPARGEGASKRAAEQAAATALLAREGVWRTRPMSEPAPATETRCGFVAVIGAPNAGKSTLVNALVGAKVSIVSHKVQTTRMPVRGIAIEGASQLVFIDTPGIFAPAPPARPGHGGGRLGRRRRCRHRRPADRCRAGASTRTSERILGQAAGRARPRRSWSLNKIDRVKKERLLDLAARLQRARCRSTATFMISALSGDGVADLKPHLAAHACRRGPGTIPADEISDAPLRLLAAEITREKIFERLHEELPYEATVETTAWQEQQGRPCASSRPSTSSATARRRIVLGKGGRTIKQLSMRGARRSWPRSWSSPCTSSCSSRCARTGATTPSATARWGWRFRRIDRTGDAM